MLKESIIVKTENVVKSIRTLDKKNKGVLRHKQRAFVDKLYRCHHQYGGLTYKQYMVLEDILKQCRNRIAWGKVT